MIKVLIILTPSPSNTTPSLSSKIALSLDCKTLPFLGSSQTVELVLVQAHQVVVGGVALLQDVDIGVRGIIRIS